MRETRTISMQETKALNRLGKQAEQVAAEETTTADAEEDLASSDTDENGESAEKDEKSSGWNLFKRGKSAVKKKPGKLPPRPDQPTKDSREAAADILREMTRRR